MKFLLSTLAIVGLVIVFAFVLANLNPNRIVVANTGVGPIEVEIDGTKRHKLGSNGTNYFDRNSRIQIGDAAIKVGKRIEVKNTGSGEIRIVYNEAKGSEKTLLLGEGGTGYMDKSTPFKIGDASIRVGKMQQ